MKSSTRSLPPLKAAKLLDQVRERIRYLHYSIRTEQSYVHWVRAFVRFHGLRHPRDMGGPEVETFLSWLAGERRVAVATHKQALSALLFLYQKVLGVDLPWMSEMGHPRTRTRLPVVLTHDEVARLLAAIDAEHRLLAQLLYGTGMRITEAISLRVKDVDFERRAVVVREGKGGKDRVVMLPDALARKYPRAGASWTWFWVFPQAALSVDPRTGALRRHHVFDRTDALAATPPPAAREPQAPYALHAA